MPQGLPRKIRVAFILQALLASVVISLSLLAAGLLVRHRLMGDGVHAEATHFWAGHKADPAFPLPNTSTMRGYFEPANEGAANLEPVDGSAANLPQAIRRLGPGMHDWPVTKPGQPRRVVYVDRRPEGTLYLLFQSTLIDRAILMTAAVSLLVALLATYFVSWLTYRISKRLVTPVGWLANVVSQWDPRAPDATSLAPGNLPDEAGSEVQGLSQALRELAGRVGEFVQRERDFTRDASHELRTPLTVIRVATDLMLAEPDLAPRVLRSLGRVQRAGRDMEAVIDAFLILAREADVEPLSEELAVRDIVNDEVERARALIANKPVELVLIDDGAPHLVAPRHVLNVMVGNLLSNAARYTDQGQIVLHLAGDRIEVRDSGIGMSADTLAKAFDPFFRVDNERLEGKGIGLSIVRRLGERFGWPVTLTSAPGKGTTAVIRFDT